MNRAPQHSTQQPMNLAHLRHTVGDDTEFIIELCGIYIDDARNRLAKLDCALAAADRESITEAAHALKGSSGNVGAERMNALAAELEKVDFVSDPEKAHELATQLHAEFAEVTTFVKRFVRSPL